MAGGGGGGEGGGVVAEKRVWYLIMIKLEIRYLSFCNLPAVLGRAEKKS